MDRTPDPSPPPVGKPPRRREPGKGPLLEPRRRRPGRAGRPGRTASRKTTAIGAGLLTAGALAAVLWATTSGGEDQPDRQATTHWLDQGGQAALNQLSADVHTMATATSTAAMSQACTTFKADLRHAQALGPIPDPEAQRHWSAGVTAALGGAEACVDTNAASADSARQQSLTRMGDDLTESEVEFQKLRARLLEFAHATG